MSRGCEYPFCGPITQKPWLSVQASGKPWSTIRKRLVNHNPIIRIAGRMQHLRFGMRKDLVKCADLLGDEALDRLRRGVELSDGPTRPSEVKRVRDSGKYTHLRSGSARAATGRCGGWWKRSGVRC